MPDTTHKIDQTTGDLREAIRHLSSTQHAIVTDDGQPVAAIVGIEEWADFQDFLAYNAYQKRLEAGETGPTISHEEAKRRLGL